MKAEILTLSQKIQQLAYFHAHIGEFFETTRRRMLATGNITGGGAGGQYAIDEMRFAFAHSAARHPDVWRSRPGSMPGAFDEGGERFGDFLPFASINGFKYKYAFGYDDRRA